MDLQNSNRLIDSGQIYSCMGWGKDVGKRQRVWDGRVHTAIFKVDDQQGPTV